MAGRGSKQEFLVSKLDESIQGLKYNDQGLIPAIVVDVESRQVLMMAWMNAEALKMTLQTGRTHFWSRSRQKFWMKGEASGHVQEVRGVYVDCDADALLIEVVQHGAACHEGYRSCFFRELHRGNWEVIAEKVFDPEKTYGQ